MKKNRYIVLLGLLAAANSPTAHALTPQQSAGQSSSESDQQVAQLFKEEWDFRRSEFGVNIESESDPAFLPQVDRASQLRRADFWKQLLVRLDRIDEQKLSADRRVDAAVFRTVLRNYLIEAKAQNWEMPFNSDTSFWSSLDSSDGWGDVASYEAYLARLSQLPRYFEQNQTNMEEGLKRGFSVPFVTLKGRDQSIAAYITDSAQTNPYYRPFRSIPDSIPADEANRLRQSAQHIIETQVMPAYVKLLAYMNNAYLLRARRTISARDMPNGPQFYREQVQLYTTLPIDPKEVHKIGLREVAELEKQIAQAATAAGLKGSIPEVFAQLRNDKRFTASSPEDLLMRTAWIAKRVDGKIGNLIGKLPRQRFTIRPVPDAIAPFYTSGRGGREACWMNTYNLPSRPLYALTALTLHECSPGHSLQTALAAEHAERPEFRRRTYFSGYSEGWGLYSEWLGVEMGLYDTPFDELGRLSYAMWRACRLVIDTGIHQYGWTREQAVDYLRNRTGLSDHEIQTEIDRYISWPGQALSYKLGELEIRRLRNVAETKLGTRFSAKEFHDAILDMGSVPLSVLNQEMEAWIELQTKTNPNS